MTESSHSTGLNIDASEALNINGASSIVLLGEGDMLRVDVSQLERNDVDIAKSAIFTLAVEYCTRIASDSFKRNFPTRESWDCIPKEQKVRKPNPGS